MFHLWGNHYSSPLWGGKSLCSNCCYSTGLFPFTEMKSSLDFQLPWSKALSAPSCGRVGRRGEEWSETCGLGKAGKGTGRRPRAMPAPQPPRSLPVIVQTHKRDQITTWKFWNNTVFFIVKYKIRSWQIKKKTAILYGTLIFQCRSAQKLLDLAVLIITLTWVCNLKGA